MREMVVLRVTAKMLIPFILLYALYVQFHGDFGPGGGFQAGVITAAGLILYGLVFGLDQLKRAVPQRVLEITLAIGLLMYGGTGWVTLLLGGNFLEYGYLAQHHPVHGQHYGIAMIEGGVGVGVASGLLVIYYALAGRGRR
ncbi:MAG: Na(+)/H(+) antiporter subunit B [Deltaproteobacteria bacterium]|nr:Na(+)/H(+) antiporter subunit B [Deltaproteobacteria bacterium]